MKSTLTGSAVTRGAWVCAAAGALCMLPSLSNDFVDWDDMQYVVLNPALKGSWTQALAFFSGYYHPLTTLSYKLDLALFGLNPAAFHAVNLLLYAACCGLAHRLFAALGASGLAALAGGLMFAVHPLHVEPVAWVSGRKELLWSLFALLSLLSYLRYLAAGGKRALALSFLYLFLSALSKPSAVVLPLVMLLADLYRGRRPGMRVLLEKALLAAPVALLAAFSGTQASSMLAAVSPELASGGAVPFSFTGAIATGLHSLLGYLSCLVIPAGLTPLYPAVMLPLHKAWYLAGGTLLAAFCARRLHRAGLTAFRSRFTFAALFFLLCLMSGLAITPPADRYMFLPLAGAALAYGELVSRLFSGRKPARMILMPLLAAHLLVLAVLSWEYTGTWRDSMTLWERVLAVNPGEAVGHYGRGNALRVAGAYGEAEAAYTRASELSPSYWRPLANRGRLKAERGDHAGALADYNSAIAMYPWASNLFLNRGNSYFKLGRYREAAADYKEALQLAPGAPQAADNLAAAERALRAGKGGSR